MASPGMKILALVIGFLFISSEGRPWHSADENPAVDAKPTSGDAPLKKQEVNTDDVPVQGTPTSGDISLKKQEAASGHVPVQENPTSGDASRKNKVADSGDITAQKKPASGDVTGQEQPASGDGDTKTFGTIISYFLGKIPFLNKNKETVTTTVTTSNATPNIPASTATGK